VVGHTEAHHAATPEDVIAACKIARRAIDNALNGAPDLLSDPKVGERAGELVAEARLTLDAIRGLAGPDADDPLTDPATLARAVTAGIMDAPHLRNNRFGRGAVATRIDRRGACVAVDNESGNTLTEQARLAALLSA
jgi:hypothetical protein